MGELIFFQEALKKQRKHAPDNLKALCRSLKASGWGQSLIKLAITAAAVEPDSPGPSRIISVDRCDAREEKHG